jgi:hypothetical protein
MLRLSSSPSVAVRATDWLSTHDGLGATYSLTIWDLSVPFPGPTEPPEGAAAERSDRHSEPTESPAETTNGGSAIWPTTHPSPVRIDQTPTCVFSQSVRPGFIELFL